MEDVSDLVARQRPHARPPYDALVTPREAVYSPADPAVALRLGLAPWTDPAP